MQTLYNPPGRIPGDLVLVSGGSIKTTGNGDLTLLPHGTGITIVGDAGSTSHTLNTNDDLFVAGRLEVDGTFYLDGGFILAQSAIFLDDVGLRFGSGADTRLEFDTGQTNDMLLFGLDTGSKTIVFCDVDDLATDFAWANQSNPTIALQAADATDITKWGSLSRDDNDFVIGVGAGGNGDLFLNPDGVVKFGTHSAIAAETVTGYITIKDAGGASRKLAVVS